MKREKLIKLLPFSFPLSRAMGEGKGIGGRSLGRGQGDRRAKPGARARGSEGEAWGEGKGIGGQGRGDRRARGSEGKGIGGRGQGDRRARGSEGEGIGGRGDRRARAGARARGSEGEALFHRLFLKYKIYSLFILILFQLYSNSISILF